MKTNRYDDNHRLASYHNYPIQKINDFRFNPSPDHWVDSLDGYPNSSTQGTFPDPTPVQSQSTDLACSSYAVDDSTAARDVTREALAEGSCVNDKVHCVESELRANAEMESRYHTPITLESSFTALDSGKSAKPEKLHRASNPSYNISTEPIACEKVCN